MIFLTENKEKANQPTIEVNGLSEKESWIVAEQIAKDRGLEVIGILQQTNEISNN